MGSYYPDTLLRRTRRLLCPGSVEDPAQVVIEDDRLELGIIEDAAEDVRHDYHTLTVRLGSRRGTDGMPGERAGKRREVMEYVDTQSAAGIRATHAVRVDTKRHAGRRYDIWDVDCSDGTRWWVITNLTNLTNLYSQDMFRDADTTFTFHLGLMERLSERHLGESPAGGPERDRLAGAWRRWRQGAKALEEADEAEDIQAVGVRCREALLAFARDVAGPQWLLEGETAPKRGDFKGWTERIARTLAPPNEDRSKRLNALLEGMARLTWDYVVNLQHNRHATTLDGTMGVAATADVLGLYGLTIVRHERGMPDRCPKCASYRLDSEYSSDTDTYLMYCEACGWESDPRPAPL